MASKTVPWWQVFLDGIKAGVASSPVTSPATGPIVVTAGAAANEAADAAAGNPLGGLGGLLPHFGSAELRQFAVRGLKIVIGIALVITGVVQLTHLKIPSAVPVPV